MYALWCYALRPSVTRAALISLTRETMAFACVEVEKPHLVVVVEMACVVSTAAAEKAVRAAGVAPKNPRGSEELRPMQTPSEELSPRYVTAIVFPPYITQLSTVTISTVTVSLAF